MVVSRSLLFILAAVICFAVALLVSLGAVQSSFDSWVAGGLLSFALAHLP
jgi:hypothetical protein